MKKSREYTVIIEQDEQGIFVADVPEIAGCHTQAKSLDVLMDRVKEAIQLCVEVQKLSARKRAWSAFNAFPHEPVPGGF